MKNTVVYSITVIMKTDHDKFESDEALVVHVEAINAFLLAWKLTGNRFSRLVFKKSMSGRGPFSRSEHGSGMATFLDGVG